MNSKEAKQILADLFNSIGWEGVVENAFSNECRNAILHGLSDAAFDEWEDAEVFINATCCVRRVSRRSEIELWHLQEEFPDKDFRDDREVGLQWYRGRLFSLRDYQLAKEAIAVLGNDKFAEEYEQRFGKKLIKNSHLW